MKTSHSVFLNSLNEQKVEKNHKLHRIDIVFLLDETLDVLNVSLTPHQRCCCDESSQFPVSMVISHLQSSQFPTDCFSHLWHQQRWRPPAQGSGAEPLTFSHVSALSQSSSPLNRSNTNQGGQQAWHEQPLESSPSKYYANLTSSANLAAAHEDGRERSALKNAPKIKF